VTGHPDKIPPFDVLVKEIELVIADIILADIQLDLATLIPEVSKKRFPMVPYDIHPSRGRYLFCTLLVGDIAKTGLDLLNGILPVKGMGIGCDTFFP
jgi:hypothetical protein